MIARHRPPRICVHIWVHVCVCVCCTLDVSGVLRRVGVDDDRPTLSARAALQRPRPVLAREIPGEGGRRAFGLHALLVTWFQTSAERAR